tara:strand:+ start:311 stop:928 length:618 start_codon:yes stop_codon:yes gene_type:complete
MTLLILARHGNTFEPGETPVWVGAREDLPLAEKGLEQAEALGTALSDRDIQPARIMSGPLIRTRKAAEIVRDRLASALAIEIDDRLKEIDYGSWGGKSDDQIIAEFGEDALAAWRDRNERPANADWSPDAATLRANAMAVLQDSQSDTGPVLVITSNGILRYFHAALGFDGDAKVRTGHVGAARLEARAARPLFWNCNPADGLDL